jgi:hypothetical protein
MVNFEVVHITQYVSELINEGRLELNKEYGKKVTIYGSVRPAEHAPNSAPGTSDK